MAEQAKPTPVAFKFDALALSKHLDSLEAKAKESAGKPGCNPFLWINAHIAPLRAKVAKEQTEATANAVNALKVPEKPI